MKLQLFRDRAHSFIAREYIISELWGLLNFSTGNFPGIGGKTFRRTAVYANMSLHPREWKDTFGRKYTYFTVNLHYNHDVGSSEPSDEPFAQYCIFVL